MRTFDPCGGLGALLHSKKNTFDDIVDSFEYGFFYLSLLVLRAVFGTKIREVSGCASYPTSSRTPSSMLWLGPKSADRRAGQSSMELVQRVHGAVMESLVRDFLFMPLWSSDEYLGST